MILSPVLRIPSWPAGPFSEIFEIKIPCKGQQKNIALHTATRVSPTVFSYSRYFLAPEKDDSYMKRSGSLPENSIKLLEAILQNKRSVATC